MNQPLVSVIIPCYCCEQYLDETLKCLAAQTYKNIQVICVNDGSTDGTLDALQRWQQAGKLNMCVIDQPNGGVSRARNRGIEAAAGEYLMFCDADDHYHPRMIGELVEAIEAFQADTAYCLLSRKRETVMEAQPDKGFIGKSREEAMHDLLYRMAEIGFYCYIYRGEIVRRHQLLFDVNTRHFEDREFNWNYLCHCQGAAFVDAPLYWYRIAPNSATTKKTAAWRTDGLEAVLRISAYMKKMHCSYASEIDHYLFPRVIWSMAKNYALGGDRTLLKRLADSYDVKACMKRTVQDQNKMVALASRLYLIHPMLFYHIVRLKK